MLFALGLLLGRDNQTPAVRTGLFMAILGIGLVAIAIALGG